MSPVELEVLEANAAFYRAFTERDAGAMVRLWAERLPVACIHPGWDALSGRDEVLSSWERILGSEGSPEVRCTLAEAHVLGEVALVTCHEVLEGGRLAATNVYAREDGVWRLVHHQASPMAPGQARHEPTGGAKA
jgi:ketosteroid isomerase-like protein